MTNSSTRRNFLRGLGLSVALPLMESAVPQSLAETSQQFAVTPDGDPLRTAFLYVPNGVNVSKWFPKGEGSDYQLNETMQPLSDLKSDFQVVSGLAHENGSAGKDGAGDHARAHSSFLTASRPYKTAGADIKLGVSIDQEMAKYVGKQTRLASLELSCDGSRKSGKCDSGYSCAYQFNLSWRNEVSPMTAEHNPRLVFERLFGAGAANQRQQNFNQRMAERRSVLDFVLDETQSLSKQLGRNDIQKLDEYLTGVRQIEQRIEKAEVFGDLPDIEMESPAGIPREYAEHIRLMFDMMVMAFQTDSTRISSFMLAHDGSNRNFNEVGVSQGHHSLSHHGNKDSNLDKLAKIDKFYMEQFAYFLKRLKQAKDVSGRSVLENSMIVYGSGLCDGNRHQHYNLPIIMAGHGGGTIKPGRHVELNHRDKTPMANLFVSMMQRMGISDPDFGDSNGSLEAIA